MNKKKLVLFAIFFIIAGIQFVPVNRTNPPVEAEVQASAEVKKILETACYDCHSYQTKWPFYAYIAPVSFMVANDVRKGRQYLNFSTWDAYSPEERQGLKEGVVKQIEEGKMPLAPYKLMHPNSKITEEQLNILRAWAKPVVKETPRPVQPPVTEKKDAAVDSSKPSKKPPKK
jgi:DNA primase large subunit